MNNTCSGKKENIVFAHSVSVLGGAERVSLAVIESVSENYCSILVTPKGELQKFAQDLNASVQSLNYHQPSIRQPLKSLNHIAKTVRFLKRCKPIAVHTGDILALRSFSPACKITSTPIICHVHFPYDESFMNWVFSNSPPVSTFIYCSNELKEALQPYLRKLVPEAEHVVIHNGIDVRKFSPLDFPAVNVIPRIGIVGNLQKRKGHEEFLQMAELLLARGIEAEFDIIGGDILQEPRQSLLESEARRLKIDDKIKFHGQVDDVLPLLHKLDILVCASHEEAFPVTILEAMACKKAIVTTNVNGITEAIDERCGVLTPPHDAQALANGVSFLLENEIVKEDKQENARARVVKLFSSGVFKAKILNLYRSLSMQE